MTVYRKVNSSWERSTQYYKTSGSWNRATWYYKANGSWTAVSGLVVDNFEDGDRSGWDVPSSTGDDTVIAPGLNATNYGWRLENFRDPHLAGPDAVDRGPQPGDVWEFWFRVVNTSGDVINRVEFATYGSDDPNHYYVEFPRFGHENTLLVRKISNGNQEKESVVGGGLATERDYRCEIRWNAGDNQITAQLFDADGSVATNQASITDDSEASGAGFTDQGIRLFNSANNVCIYDQFRIID